YCCRRPPYPHLPYHNSCPKRRRTYNLLPPTAAVLPWPRTATTRSPRRCHTAAATPPLQQPLAISTIPLIPSSQSPTTISLSSSTTVAATPAVGRCPLLFPAASEAAKPSSVLASASSAFFSITVKPSQPPLHLLIATVAPPYCHHCRNNCCPFLLPPPLATTVVPSYCHLLLLPPLPRLASYPVAVATAALSSWPPSPFILQRCLPPVPPYYCRRPLPQQLPQTPRCLLPPPVGHHCPHHGHPLLPLPHHRPALIFFPLSQPHLLQPPSSYCCHLAKFQQLHPSFSAPIACLHRQSHCNQNRPHLRCKLIPLTR
ncbi:hypothetical protein GW17_00047826, partial [Ensete ventricosum]